MLDSVGVGIVILEVKFKLWLIGDWFCSNLVTMSFLESILLELRMKKVVVDNLTKKYCFSFEKVLKRKARYGCPLQL